MPIVMHAVMLPVAAALWGRLPWEEWLTPQGDGLYHTPVSRGWGALTASGLVRRITMNIVVGLIANSTLAFFEEVGWRAWMLPRLVVLIGTRRSIVVSSMIWAFWHTPLAFSGIHHLDGIPIVLTALTMPIVISGAGLVIGWLWVRTESIWMVALAHRALNNLGQFAFKFMGGAWDWAAQRCGGARRGWLRAPRRRQSSARVWLPIRLATCCAFAAIECGCRPIAGGVSRDD
jgi:membrane protease YdiL (CAAX protease family)